MPPASDTTSGRLATANSARISEAVIPAVRAANRSLGIIRMVGSFARIGRRTGSDTAHPPEIGADGRPERVERPGRV